MQEPDAKLLGGWGLARRGLRIKKVGLELKKYFAVF